VPAGGAGAEDEYENPTKAELWSEGGCSRGASDLRADLPAGRAAALRRGVELWPRVEYTSVIVVRPTLPLQGESPLSSTRARGEEVARLTGGGGRLLASCADRQAAVTSWR
jgi:hypothetical protein